MLPWSLLFVVLVVGGLLLALRAWRGGSAASSTGSSALRILEDRFARGEIDRDEFESRRGTLEP